MIMKGIFNTAITLPPLQPFLYLLWYFVFSILGNYNYFFFAAHLIDVAVGVAALRIILEAITHNGKQVRCDLIHISQVPWSFLIGFMKD